MLELDERFFGRFGVEYSPNQIIFCEFEPGFEFYFIQKGKVRIVKIINDREKTVDVLGPGDVFGEMAILDISRRQLDGLTVQVTECGASGTPLHLYAKAVQEIDT